METLQVNTGKLPTTGYVVLFQAIDIFSDGRAHKAYMNAARLVKSGRHTVVYADVHAAHAAAAEMSYVTADRVVAARTQPLHRGAGGRHDAVHAHDDGTWIMA